MFAGAGEETEGAAADEESERPVNLGAVIAKPKKGQRDDQRPGAAAPKVSQVSRFRAKSGAAERLLARTFMAMAKMANVDSRLRGLPICR